MQELSTVTGNKLGYKNGGRRIQEQIQQLRKSVIRNERPTAINLNYIFYEGSGSPLPHLHQRGT